MLYRFAQYESKREDAMANHFHFLINREGNGG